VDRLLDDVAVYIAYLDKTPGIVGGFTTDDIFMAK
jgi:hypothetical protein